MTVAVNPNFNRSALIAQYDFSDTACYDSRENAITYSDQFDNGAWFKDSCTVTANATAAPDKTITADAIVSTITGGVNNVFVNQTVNVGTNIPHTYSVYVKRGTSPSTFIDFFIVSPYTEVWGKVTWDANGVAPTWTTGYGGAATASTLLANSLTDVGNGWFRASLTMSSATGTQFACRVYGRDQGTANVTGEYSYVWGAQCERSYVASPYTPTTSTAVTRPSTTINNKVNSSYPGTLTGAGITYDYQNLGTSRWNNSTSNVITAYTIPDSFWQGAWSVCAWVRFFGVNKGQDNSIVGHGSVTTRGGLHLGERSLRLYFGLYSDDLAYGNTVLNANQWYHVVWTHNPVSYTRKMSVNGVIATYPGTGPYTGTGTNTEIGRYPWAPTGYMMYGNIPSIQFYNTELSDADILMLFSSMRGRYGV